MPTYLPSPCEGNENLRFLPSPGMKIGKVVFLRVKLRCLLDWKENGAGWIYNGCAFMLMQSSIHSLCAFRCFVLPKGLILRHCDNPLRPLNWAQSSTKAAKGTAKGFKYTFVFAPNGSRQETKIDVISYDLVLLAVVSVVICSHLMSPASELVGNWGMLDVSQSDRPEVTAAAHGFTLGRTNELAGLNAFKTVRLEAS